MVSDDQKTPAATGRTGASRITSHWSAPRGPYPGPLFEAARAAQPIDYGLISLGEHFPAGFIPAAPNCGSGRARPAPPNASREVEGRSEHCTRLIAPISGLAAELSRGYAARAPGGDHHRDPVHRSALGTPNVTSATPADTRAIAKSIWYGTGPPLRKRPLHHGHGGGPQRPRLVL